MFKPRKIFPTASLLLAVLLICWPVQAANLDEPVTQPTAKSLEAVAPIIKQLDDAMASQPFKDARSDEDVAQIQQSLDLLKNRINAAISDLPRDDPQVVTIRQKISGYDQTIVALAGAVHANRAANKLLEQWTILKDNFSGWDDEKDCPTWKQWTQNSNDSMNDLEMPKTVQLMIRVGPWLNDDRLKSLALQYPDNTSIKATIAEANMMYDAASLKMNQSFDKLADEAELIISPKQSDREGITHLASRVDYWFKGTAYHDANAARVKAVMDRWKIAAATTASGIESDSKRTASPKAVTTETPAAAAGTPSSFTELLEHLIELSICVAAGVLVILKVRPAVAGESQTTSDTFPTNQQIELAGLGLVAVGLLWLLVKRIVGDLLPAGCLTLCGLILASNWFIIKGLLPSKMASMLKAFAMPIAGACILFGVLHLFLAHWNLF